MGFFGYYVRLIKGKVKRSKLCRRFVRVCKDVSSISDLPDELLIKILSFVPTKVAVSTSILSKQWQFLWTWLLKLEYRYCYYSDPFREFIDKNLPLHRAHVLETLHLELSDKHIKPADIKRWFGVAVSCYVRELEISYYSDNSVDDIFPSSFYTCDSPVILKLSHVILTDIPTMVCLPSLKTLKLSYVTLMSVPSLACLPSLKTLVLQYLTYEDDESLQGLLDISPILEDLSLVFYSQDSEGDSSVMGEITVIVPTLQRLSLFVDSEWDLEGYVIDTLSLKYFKFEDRSNWTHNIEIKDMPELKEKCVDVVSSVLKSVVGSFTSVNHLTICLEISKRDGEDDVYSGGFVFNQLDHLELCPCKENSSDIIGQLLKDSPRLRVLDISDMEYGLIYLSVLLGLSLMGENERNKMVCWNQPSHVPECLLSSLQILNWSRYFGRPQKRDIAVYILKHAYRLKTTTIIADTLEHFVPNLKMIKELAFSSRASSTCELVFVEGYPAMEEDCIW